MKSKITVLLDDVRQSSETWLRDQFGYSHHEINDLSVEIDAVLAGPGDDAVKRGAIFASMTGFGNEVTRAATAASVICDLLHWVRDGGTDDDASRALLGGYRDYTSEI